VSVSAPAPSAATVAAPAASALQCHPLSVRVGFGGGGIANLYREISDAQADATLAAAHAGGIRYYDTAPLYGHGLSELRLGRFLRSLPRDGFLLSTKIGRYLLPPRGQPIDKGIWAPPLNLKPVFDYGYDGAMRALEQSINRLGLERVDIVYIHDLDRRAHGADYARQFAVAMGGAYRALDELRSAGHVGAIGVGVNEADVAAEFVRAGRFDCVLLAGRYSLLDQTALDDFLPLALARGVDVVVAGVFNSGILATVAGRPDAKAMYDYAEAPPAIVGRARRLASLCARFDVALPAAALRFPFGHAAVRTVLVGMSKPEQVRQNLAWLAAPVPAALWAQMKDEELLPENVPLPGEEVIA